MSESVKEQWLNAKFDARMIISLKRNGQYLNPSVSIIGGKQYNTKMGNAMQVQLGIKDLNALKKTIDEIIEIMDREMPQPQDDDIHETT